MNNHAEEAKIKFPFSIFHKMMFHVVLLVVFVVGINTFLSVRAETEIIRKGLIQKGKNLAMYISASTESAFWSLNWIFVERLLQKTGKYGQEEIIFAKVVKPNGEVYLANDKKYYGEIIDSSVLLNHEIILRNYVFSVNRQKGVLLLYPFPIEKDRWFVLLGLSMKPIEEVTNALILRNMISGSLILLCALVVSFFLSKSFSRPIITLSKAAGIVADGKLNQRVHIRSRDEVGLLCHSFNRMIKKLKAMKEVQKESHNKLEHLVEIRTTVLNQKIAEHRQTESSLRNSEARLKAILQASPTPIIVYDKQGFAQYLNQAFEQVFGWTSDELNGKRIPFVPNDEIESTDAKIHAVYKNRGITNLETRRLTKDGRTLNILGNAALILENEDEPAGTVVSLMDITDRKKTEHAIQQAQAEAEAANRAKSEFLANMSHEIRTPMNAILGFAEILDEKIYNKQHRHYLSMIRASGRSLMTLIDDILDLSKIEAGKLKLEYNPINPVIVFKEIAAMFAQKIEAKGLHFSLETDFSMTEYLLLDEVRLRQILLNLVGNAIKFTESGYIKISVQTLAYKETPDTIDFILAVEDTGIGIPEEQKKTIFDAFEQQNGQDHAAYGGTGLGLTITKRLTEMMGGVISITSEKGKGSIFTVTLKNVRKAEKGESAEKETEISADSIVFDNAVILIADDLMNNRILLCTILEDYGFEFLEAENGGSAIELARSHHPDIILMDWVMPVTGGREATQNIKAYEKTSTIPIVAITAAAMKDDEMEINALCDGYLKKPVKKEALIAELARFLSHSKKKAVPGPSASSKSEENLIIKKEPAPYEPDAETKRKIPGLLRLLESEFMPQWKEISAMMVMDEVKQLADDLNHIGRNYRFQPLTEFGDQLSGCVEIYDVEGVKMKIAEFPKIIEQMKRYII